MRNVLLVLCLGASGGRHSDDTACDAHFTTVGCIPDDLKAMPMTEIQAWMRDNREEVKKIAECTEAAQNKNVAESDAHKAYLAMEDTCKYPDEDDNSEVNSEICRASGEVATQAACKAYCEGQGSTCAADLSGGCSVSNVEKKNFFGCLNEVQPPTEADVAAGITEEARSKFEMDLQTAMQVYEDACSDLVEGTCLAAADAHGCKWDYDFDGCLSCESCQADYYFKMTKALLDLGCNEVNVKAYYDQNLSPIAKKFDALDAATDPRNRGGACTDSIAVCEKYDEKIALCEDSGHSDPADASSSAVAFALLVGYLA